MSEKEQRISVRFRKYIDVALEDALSSMLLRGAMTDISSEGMRIIVDQYLAVGTKYLIAMKRNPFLRLRGEVRWIRPFQGDTYHVGIRIIEPTEEDTTRLNSFLELERQRLTTD